MQEETQRQLLQHAFPLPNASLFSATNNLPAFIDIADHDADFAAFDAVYQHHMIASIARLRLLIDGCKDWIRRAVDVSLVRSLMPSRENHIIFERASFSLSLLIGGRIRMGCQDIHSRVGTYQISAAQDDGSLQRRAASISPSHTFEYWFV